MVGNHNNLVIQRLIVQNTADNANLTVNGATAGVIIQDIVSHSGMGPGGGGDCRCFDIRDCIAADAGAYAVILQHCTGTTRTPRPRRPIRSGRPAMMACWCRKTASL